ncbi:MAG: leucyl/phenylalanyl-tRNA--protein transferase [Nitrosomonadales bacterium]|nr:leucyl/phenylalanyl-tRNA--protein transferase [Nitrosomonadales bacterium]
MIPWLDNDTPFPPVERALRSPDGLLAAGGDLSPARLLEAYRHGIFPWFNPGEPILWWSPDPRMVLMPDEFSISRSLAKTLRKATHEVRVDTAFERVMRACAAPRKGADGGCDTVRDSDGSGSSRQAALPAPEGSATPCQGGTWISAEMITAYGELHRMGYAHSVEVWMDGELSGGLYGIAIGRMFYGESMFSRKPDASKIALAHLSAQLVRWRFGMIDCQMSTPHLSSLGAREIPRSEFIARLRELIHYDPVNHWCFDDDLYP